MVFDMKFREDYVSDSNICIGPLWEEFGSGEFSIQLLKADDFKNKIILGDEISPDNCRLWDLKQKNGTIVSLDKDRFRNDLGGLIEACSEINRRINDFI